MIALNHGTIVGYVNRPPKFKINKKDRPQAWMTIYQPNPKVSSQIGRADPNRRRGIYVTVVAFDELATKVRDLYEKGDFVICWYTVRNIFTGKGGVGHILNLVNAYKWRPHQDAKQGDDGLWRWASTVDGNLADFLPPEEGGDGDRPWSLGSS